MAKDSNRAAPRAVVKFLVARRAHTTHKSKRLGRKFVTTCQNNSLDIDSDAHRSGGSPRVSERGTEKNAFCIVNLECLSLARTTVVSGQPYDCADMDIFLQEVLQLKPNKKNLMIVIAMCQTGKDIVRTARLV